MKSHKPTQHHIFFREDIKGGGGDAHTGLNPLHAAPRVCVQPDEPLGPAGRGSMSQCAGSQTKITREDPSGGRGFTMFFYFWGCHFVMALDDWPWTCGELSGTMGPVLGNWRSNVSRPTIINTPSPPREVFRGRCPTEVAK